MQIKLNLLKLYFVLQLCFGVVVSLIIGISNYPNLFIIYMATGFPVYFIVYNTTNYSLTNKLKYNYPSIHEKFGFKNPFTNQIRNTTLTLFFNKKLNIKNEEVSMVIELGKLSFIFSLISFISFPMLAIISYML